MHRHYQHRVQRVVGVALSVCDQTRYLLPTPLAHVLRNRLAL